MSNSSLRAPFTGHGPTDRGLLTHLLVATQVPLLDQGRTAESLVAPMVAMADLLIAGNRNRTAAVRSGAVSLANRYLAKCAMSGHGWQLLGVEYDTGHGFADVAWKHDATGAVLFDEIKTSGSARWAPPAWVYQVARYNLGGQEQFGDLFVGTRLLPLARMDIAEWFPQWNGPDGHKIAPTPGDPLRPATEADTAVTDGGQ